MQSGRILLAIRSCVFSQTKKHNPAKPHNVEYKVIYAYMVLIFIFIGNKPNESIFWYRSEISSE